MRFRDVELAQKYGTTDIEEAIRREMAEVDAEERPCAWPGCEVDLAGEHPSKQYCDPHRAQRDRESRRKAKASPEDGAEMSGTTMEEILHDKVQEMRQMSETRKCVWPDCTADVATKTGKYCAPHSAEARQAARAAGGASRKGKTKKPKSPCEKCQRENCDDRGRPEKTCTRFTLNKGEKAEPVKPEPPAPEIPTQEEIEAECICDHCENADFTSYEDENVCKVDNAPLTGDAIDCIHYKLADPRPAPEDYRPPIDTLPVGSDACHAPDEPFPMTAYQLNEVCRMVQSMTQPAMNGFVIGYIAGRRAA